MKVLESVKGAPPAMLDLLQAGGFNGDEKTNFVFEGGQLLMQHLLHGAVVEADDVLERLDQDLLLEGSLDPLRCRTSPHDGGRERRDPRSLMRLRGSVDPFTLEMEGK